MRNAAPIAIVAALMLSCGARTGLGVMDTRDAPSDAAAVQEKDAAHVVSTLSCDVPTTPSALFADEEFPKHIVVTERWLVWSTTGAIRAAPKCGGAATTVASASGVMSLTATDIGIVWAESQGPVRRLLRVADVGGPAAVLTERSAGEELLGHTADATAAYWYVDGSDGGIWKWTSGSEQIERLASIAGWVSYFSPLTQNEEGIFMCNSTSESPSAGNLVRIAKRDGRVSRLWRGAVPNSLVADADHVYLSHMQSVDTITSIEFVDNRATTIAAKQRSPRALAMNHTSLYWATVDRTSSALVRMGKSDSTVEVLATGRDIRGIAVNAQSVYFTDYRSGTVSWRVP